MGDYINKQPQSVEKVSQTVLYSITVLSIIIFIAFFIIGFDVPYAGDSSFNAPVLTDAVLILIYVLLLSTIGVMAFSLIKGLRCVSLSAHKVNNIPARKITTVVFGVTFLLLVFTFFCGSTASMMVNGILYSDKFWLQATDMFINTILVQMLVSIGTVVFGATRYHRKRNRNK